MAEIILDCMAQRYELARLRIGPHRHRILFKRALYLHDIFAKEEETARWKVPLRPLHITDGSAGGDRDNGAIRQAQGVLRLRSRHVRSEFRVASRNPLVQRFASNPALGAAPSPTHLQKYCVDLALMGKIPDPCAGRARYLFCLVGGHPVGVPPHGSRKVPVLAADQARPILDDELLEDIMEESEFRARKDAKQTCWDCHSRGHEPYGKGSHADSHPPPDRLETGAARSRVKLQTDTA